MAQRDKGTGAWTALSEGTSVWRVLRGGMSGGKRGSARYEARRVNVSFNQERVVIVDLKDDVRDCTAAYTKPCCAWEY